jgi:DNA-binding PadR family transcriptional regulator
MGTARERGVEVARNETDQQISVEVNEAEGAVLGLLVRTQPMTRYQMLRFFQNSPARFQNISKGSLYPLVTRLLQRGMIESNSGEGGHGAQVYSLAPLGRTALRNWTLRLESRDMLPLDPLEQRVFSLAELAPAQRIAWVAQAKQLIFDKKAELQSHRERLIQYAYGEIVYNADQERLDSKLIWLDRLLIEFAQELTAENNARPK